MTGEKTFMGKVVKPIEGGAYRLLHIDPSEEMGWRRYLACVLAFSAASLIVVMVLLMCQGWLPGNPQWALRHELGSRLQHRGQLRDQHQLAGLFG